MRNESKYKDAERERFFGLSKKTTPISKTDQKLLANAEKVANQFGIAFTDRLKVEKHEGRNLEKVDEYTAIKRPGFGSSE
jgi:hypothetical protein